MQNNYRIRSSMIQSMLYIPDHIIAFVHSINKRQFYFLVLEQPRTILRKKIVACFFKILVITIIRIQQEFYCFKANPEYKIGINFNLEISFDTKKDKSVKDPDFQVIL